MFGSCGTCGTCGRARRRRRPPPEKILSLLLVVVWISSVSVAASNGLKLARNPTSVAKLVPEFSAPIGNVSAVVGRDVRLICTVENLGQHQVAWLKEESKTILSIDTNIIITNYRIFLIPDEEGRKWVLHIKDVQESDRGFYQCQVNTNPMRSTSGYLEVVVPPVIIENETTQVVEAVENSNVTIQCKASGHPRPTISWRREDGEPIRLTGSARPTTQSKSFTNSLSSSSSSTASILDLSDVKSDRLLFTHVDRTMSGLYVCTASNGIPSQVSRQIPLYVKFPPKVSISEKSIAINLGEQLEIDCLIEAFPKPTSYWSERQLPPAFRQQHLHEAKWASSHQQTRDLPASPEAARPDNLNDDGDGRLQAQGAGAYVTVRQTAVNAYTYKLKISIARMRPVDFGEYVCISTNSMGSSSARVLVKRAGRNSQTPSAAAVGNAAQARHPFAHQLTEVVGADSPTDYQRDSMSSNEPQPQPQPTLLNNLGSDLGAGHQFIQVSKVSAEPRRSNFSMITRQTSRVYDENYLQSIRNRQAASSGYIGSTLAHGHQDAANNAAAAAAAAERSMQSIVLLSSLVIAVIWTC